MWLFINQDSKNLKLLTSSVLRDDYQRLHTVPLNDISATFIYKNSVTVSSLLQHDVSFGFENTLSPWRSLNMI